MNDSLTSQLCTHIETSSATSILVKTRIEYALLTDNRHTVAVSIIH
jgi:hypothetical protein